MHHPHKNPSSWHTDHERNVGGKLNRGVCAGDGDGRDPPQYQLEVTHMVSPIPKRKRNLDEHAPLDPDILELNMTNMEIDEANKTLAWVSLYLVVRNLIEEELA